MMIVRMSANFYKPQAISSLSSSSSTMCAINLWDANINHDFVWAMIKYLLAIGYANGFLYDFCMKQWLKNSAWNLEIFSTHLLT